MTEVNESLGQTQAGEAGMPGASIVYDGDCPFCSRYVKLVRLREALGAVSIINAREGGPLVDEIVEAGFDLDEGMVLKVDGQLFQCLCQWASG